MDDRRKKKGRNQQAYKSLIRVIHRECRLAKERWMDERCAEVEELQNRDPQVMYSKVKEVVGKKNVNENIAIKKSDRKVAMEIEDVKLRWCEYVGELFNDERPEITDKEIGNNDGPPILKEEVRCAMKSMKSGK